MAACSSPEHNQQELVNFLPCLRSYFNSLQSKEAKLEKAIEEKKLEVSTVDAYTCEKCNTAFTSQKYLLTHMRRRHRDSFTFRHKCQYCSYSTGNRCNLERHWLTHTGERPYPCPQCDKRFSQESNLKAHFFVHSGARPHQCEFCDKSFSLQGNLNAHRRHHLHEKPFKCLTCGASFSRNEVLQAHKKTHTEQKAYNCSYATSSLASIQV